MTDKEQGIAPEPLLTPELKELVTPENGNIIRGLMQDPDGGKKLASDIILAVLSHAKVVEDAYREGYWKALEDYQDGSRTDDDSWPESKAKVLAYKALLDKGE